MPFPNFWPTNVFYIIYRSIYVSIYIYISKSKRTLTASLPCNHLHDIYIYISICLSSIYEDSRRKKRYVWSGVLVTAKRENSTIEIESYTIYIYIYIYIYRIRFLFDRVLCVVPIAPYQRVGTCFDYLRASFEFPIICPYLVPMLRPILHTCGRRIYVYIYVYIYIYIYKTDIDWYIYPHFFLF